MKYGWIYETPIGKILIKESDNHIVELDFGVEGDDFELKETPILKKAGLQLEEYFARKRREFDLDIKLEGTKFQMDIWKGLTEIEYGDTLTYKGLAEKTGHKNASRAVGNANSKNPVPIFIPCHRVIKSDGSIGGYLGSSEGGISIKKYLLDLESQDIDKKSE